MIGTFDIGTILRNVIVWFLTLLLSMMGAGCLAGGTREVTVRFLGQEISVRDHVQPNTDGEDKYYATFDSPAWSIIESKVAGTSEDETVPDDPD